MTAFKIVAIPACVAFAFIARLRGSIVLTKRQNFLWEFLWLAAALVIALPSISNRIAHLFGIGRGADLVLYLMCFAAILFVLYFYNKQRRLEIIITELVRLDAIRNALPRKDNPESQ
jgi:hypothetical protein